MLNQSIKFLCVLFISTGVYASQTCQSYITDEWPDVRYTDNGNATITDTIIGLMWKKCAEGISGNSCSTGTATIMNWSDTLTLGGSTFAGYNDWRLPNIKELSSLAKLNCHNPSINQARFPNTPASKFWSSSPYSDTSKPDRAWRLDFNESSEYYDKRNISYHVRLVRAGE